MICGLEGEKKELEVKNEKLEKLSMENKKMMKEKVFKFNEDGE